MSSPPYSSDAKENSVEKRTTSSPAKGSNTPSGKPKLRSGYSSSLLQRVRQASHMSRAKQEEANREKEKNQKRSGSKRRTKDSDLKPQEADHERPDSRVGGPNLSEDSTLRSSSVDYSASNATSSSDRSEDSGGFESDSDDFVVAPAREEVVGSDEEMEEVDRGIDMGQRELESALPVWGQDEDDFINEGERDPDLQEYATPSGGSKRKRKEYKMVVRGKTLKEGTIAHAAYTVLKSYEAKDDRGLKGEQLAYLINEGGMVEKDVSLQHIHSCLKNRPEFIKLNGRFRLKESEEELNESE